MATIAQIRNDPSYLGDASALDAEEFIIAVEIVMRAGVEEALAIDIVFGTGDFSARVTAILEKNGYQPL